MKIRVRPLFTRSVERALALFLIVFGIDWYAENNGFHYNEEEGWNKAITLEDSRSIHLVIKGLGTVKVTQYRNAQRSMGIQLCIGSGSHQRVLSGAEAWIVPENQARPCERMQISEIWLSREICSSYFGFEYDCPEDVKINGMPVCLQTKTVKG